MASGGLVGFILEYSTPESSAALRGVRLSATAIKEAFTIWKFNTTTDSYLDMKCLLFGYGGGGLTLNLQWMADAATSGTVRWGAALRRIEDDSDDLDSSHTYVFNTVNDIAPGTAGYPTTVAITFTDGADMDNVANGEVFWLRIYRDVSVGGDMAGDAQLFSLQILET